MIIIVIKAFVDSEIMAGVQAKCWEMQYCDFANFDFVSINGNLEKFTLKEHVENSNSYLYSNGFLL